MNLKNALVATVAAAAALISSGSASATLVPVGPSISSLPATYNDPYPSVAYGGNKSASYLEIHFAGYKYASSNVQVTIDGRVLLRQRDLRGVHDWYKALNPYQTHTYRVIMNGTNTYAFCNTLDTGWQLLEHAA